MFIGKSTHVKGKNEPKKFDFGVHVFNHYAVVFLSLGGGGSPSHATKVRFIKSFCAMWSLFSSL